MSEKAPYPNPEQIDVNAAFDPIGRQAQAQMDIYAENRPKLDANGAAQAPGTGESINPDAYFDEQRQIAKDENQAKYEDMSIPSLAHKLGEAEYHDDRTTQDSVTEVLLDKMGTEEARIVNSGGTETEARQDNLWDSVMAAKELKKRQLEKKNGKKTNHAETSDNNEPAGDPDDGKPAGSANDNREDDGEANGSGSPENAKAFSKPRYRQYGRHLEKDRTGKVINVRGRKIEQYYDVEGDVMKWSENAEAMRPDRQIIMHARNDQGGHVVRYVSGNKIYTIDMSRGSKTSTATNAKLVEARELGPDEELEDVIIGQDIGGGFKLDSVEINTAEGFSLPSSQHSEKAPAGGIYRQYAPNGAYAPHYVFYDASGKVAMRQPVQGNPGAKLEKTPSFLKAPAALKSRESVLQTMIDQHMNAAEEAKKEGLQDVKKAEEKKAEGLQKELDGLSLNDFAFDPFRHMEDLVIVEQIQQASERFKDKTYVPTREEYDQMRELAGRIRVDYGDKGKKPIRYLNARGGQLNAKATQDFLDRVNPNRWIMNQREADVADDLRNHATLINIDRLDLEQRTRRDWLSFRQFEEEKWARNEKSSEEQLLEDYKDYLDRRIKMSEMFMPTQAANEQDGDVTEVITPDDVAMDALKSFKANVRQDLKNAARTRRRNALNRVRKTVRRPKKQPANQEADS